jgi:CBS domain containing-hemolysin-like protein
VTILVGNTIVNVALSIIAVIVTLDIVEVYNYPKDLSLFVQIVLLTTLILIFGEITPKVWAAKYPFVFSKVVSVPLYWISVLIYPVAKILSDVLLTLGSKLKFDKSKTAIKSSDLTELANIGIETGTIEEEEQELIHGLVSFKEITVREVMTPRVDIFSVSVDTTFEELMQTITDSGHSRIPLYNESLDNIVGIIYAKDLLPYLGDEELRKNLSLEKISRKVIFVPESKYISELMHEFQEKKLHIGIVVDEYGGTSGLISLEDILEEIVGEIRDEYDKEEREITKLKDGSYLVLGKVPIDELNDLLEISFSAESDDYDTVGGFIFNYAGSIPEKDFSFDYKGYKFTVVEVINNRINKVLVQAIPQESYPEE